MTRSSLQVSTKEASGFSHQGELVIRIIHLFFHTIDSIGQDQDHRIPQNYMCPIPKLAKNIPADQTTHDPIRILKYSPGLAGPYSIVVCESY